MDSLKNVFSGQGGWQELQVPVLPHPQGAHAEEEPQEDHLDRSLPQVLPKLFSTPFSHGLVIGLAPVHSCTIMSLCDLGARLAPPFHFPRSSDSGRLMRDIVPDVCFGLHLASNT